MKKRSRHEEETNEGQRRTLSERATDWILGKQKVRVPERIRSGSVFKNGRRHLLTVVS